MSSERRWNISASAFILSLSILPLCFSENQINNSKETSRINLVNMARQSKEINPHLSTQSPVDCTQAPVGYIERFFASFSSFEYNPSNPSADEFQRLRRQYSWKRGDSEGDSAWSGFRLALVKEFKRLIGTDEKDLLAWQTLCTFVGIEERFKTCEECIQVRLISSSHEAFDSLKM